MDYVTKELQRLQNPTPIWDQYSPHQWTCPQYGATKQLPNTLDTFPPIPEEHKHRIQQIVFDILYYSWAVDFTMLPDLKSIAEQQAYPTQNNEASIKHFLDYAANNPYAIVKCLASDMVPNIVSDVSYLYKPHLCNHTGGY